MNGSPKHYDICYTFEIFAPTFYFDIILDFSDFSQKCNYSVNYKINCLKLLGWIAGKHMQHVSNGSYNMTLSSHPRMDILNLGAEVFFKEIWSILQLPINFSYTIDARFVKMHS